MAINSSQMIKALQILDPVRIGELNLLLDALSRRTRHRDLAYRVISGMAARCDHTVLPDLYITIGKELRLIGEKDNVLKLTRLGKLMLSNSAWPPYDRLTDTQIEVIAPELLGHPELVQHVISIMRFIKWMPNLSLFLYPRSIHTSPEQYLALQLLQVTKFATLDSDYIGITKENYSRLNALLGDTVPRSEEDLWQSLTKTQLRARAAEEFVVKYERRRLAALHRHDLGNLVERVSATNVNAGYDVRSFEANGDSRYIEVKSSTNSHVSFYWSVIERSFALEHRDSYWIYFVPRSQELPKLKHEITLIRDPISAECKYLDLEPSDYRVWLTASIEAFPRIANGSIRARVIA